MLALPLSARADEPNTPAAKLRLATRRIEEARARLAAQPPDLAQAERAAAEALDLRKRVHRGAHVDLVEAYLMLARVHVRRAAGRPRLDHLDPALGHLDEATKALDPAAADVSAWEARVRIARGGVLRSAWRTDEAWFEHAEAVRLLMAGDEPDPALLAEALTAALESFDHAALTPTTRAARHALAPAARRLLAADGAEAAQAQALLGAALAGSAEHDAAAGMALEAAWAAAPPEDAHARSRIAWRQAWHHWHRGDLASARTTLQRGVAAYERTGRAFDAARAPLRAGGLRSWASQAALLFRNVEDGDVPAWIVRDGLPAYVGAQGRVEELWWAARQLHGALFFQDLAAAQVKQAAVGEARARALRFEALVRMAVEDPVAALARFEEAHGAWPKGRAYDIERARSQLDLGIAAHAAGRHAQAAEALGRAATAFEAAHGLRHAETLGTLALRCVALVRAGAVRETNALADRLLEALRTDAELGAWLDARANLDTAGHLARGLWHACDGLGRIDDRRFLRGRFSQRALSGYLSPLDALGEEGRYAERLARIRRPDVGMIEADAPGGSLFFAEVPRFPLMLHAIRRAEALHDVGCGEEAYAALLDAEDLLHAIDPGRYLHPQYLHADLRASTQLASTLLTRGLAEEARAVAARAHRLQTLIPRWLRQQPMELDGIWMGPETRRVPETRHTPDRVWYALSMARASEVYARALQASGEVERALSVLEEAVEVVKARAGPRHPRVAELRHAQGAASFRLGRLDAARAAETEALGIATAVYGAEHPVVADIRLSLADLDVASARYDAAREGYAFVLRITDAQLDPTHMSAIRARSGLALALSRSGDPKAGVAPMRAAVDRMARRVRLGVAGATHPQRLAMLASAQWVLANWLEVSGKADIHGYDEVLRLRSLAGRTLRAQAFAVREGSDKANALCVKLDARFRRLARLALRRPSRSWQQLAWRREIAAEQQAIAGLQRDLAKASTGYKRATALLEPAAKDVARGLRKGELLVDVLHAGGRYTAWVLAHRARPIRVDLGAAGPVDEAARALNAAVYEQHEGPSSPALTRAATEARRVLWAPIAAHVPPETKTVFVVPDATYALAPLAVLPGAQPDQVLLEQVRLAYLSMPHVLAEKPKPPSGRGAVLLGGVDYARRADAGGRVLTGRRLASLARGWSGYDALPASKVEIEQLEKPLVKSRRVRGKAHVLTGMHASESALRAAVPGKRVVHLATHATLRGGDKAWLPEVGEDRYRLQPGLEVHAHRLHPLLLAGVILSGANARVREGEDDGVLTALEASRLDLSSRPLVVLSACGSATGHPHAGEGTLGLVHAFELAGASNVVGSLWNVDDEQTLALMTAFYERWRTSGSMSAAQALRETQLAMRRGELGDAARAPAHWAAFVAYGPVRDR